MSCESMPDIGRHGIFSGLVWQEPTARAEAAAELEELGFDALWLGNSTPQQAAPIAEATSAAIVGTAIHSIWRQDAASTARECLALDAGHPGRFVLGLGVSHPEATDDYRRPYAAMTDYLGALDNAASTVSVASAVAAARRMIAALGPKMLGLSRDRAAGALPYLVTAEQVAQAREVLGGSPLLAPELGVVLESNPDKARATARAGLARYLRLENYRNNWLRGGFTSDDLAKGGSDRLIDALFAWGDDTRVRARIDAFREAGADHVALQLIGDHDPKTPPREGWRRLADLLG